MSKNIVIQEGGQGKQLTVDKLKTNLVGGGTCLWVPEDETMLGTKIITENGTYKASDDGYYGYSEVTVNGVGTATGTDSDGDEAVAHTDPETGELVTKKVPSAIVIDTPPTKTEYSVGETIDYSGMVVKAYLKSGEPWTDSVHQGGIIPTNELILPVTVITGGEEKQKDSRRSDLDISPLPNPIGVRTSYAAQGTNEYGVFEYKQNDRFVSGGSGDVALITFGMSENDGLIRYLVASSVRGPAGIYYHDRVGYNKITGEQILDEHTSTFIDANTSYTHNGKTVYYFNGTSNALGTKDLGGVQDYIWPNNTAFVGDVAWTMIYGDFIQGGSIIPVEWVRPGDGKTLETSFLITVT